MLPFVDLSEKHDREHFGDGMAEEVINLLAKLPDLKVIGRTSSFRSRGEMKIFGATTSAAPLSIPWSTLVARRSPDSPDMP